MDVYIRRIDGRDGRARYVLRESYREGGLWRHRDVVDLGWNPADHIRYSNGKTVHFSQRVERALQDKRIILHADELDEAFLPFMRYSARQHFEWSQSQRSRLRSPPRSCPTADFWKHEEHLHALDKRRLYYLRFGHVADIDHLKGRTLKFTKVLLCKSRDEIEGIVEDMEDRLRTSEIGPYLYVAFHLQKYFPHHLLRSRPEALDREALDRYFIQELCELASDPSFFRGVDWEETDPLHPYLVKYLTMYFDRGFQERAYIDDTLSYFMNSHRHYRKPLSIGSRMSVKEACRVFGITEDGFRSMSIGELTHMYRRKAKTIHPDAGGDHEAFLNLAQAYDLLLAVR